MNNQNPDRTFLNRLLEVKVGDTQEHLLKSVGNPSKQSGVLWTYQWSEPNGGYYDYFYFTVENGVVTQIKKSSGHSTNY